jgi:hypothetical protein
VDESVRQEASSACAVGSLLVFINTASDLDVSIVLVNDISVPDSVCRFIIRGAVTAVAVYSANQSPFLSKPLHSIFHGWNLPSS